MCNWKTLSLNLTILILFISCSAKSDDLADEQNANIPSEPAIMVYYVPERDYKPEEIPVEKLTHIIFSFTKVIDGEMKFSKPEVSDPKIKALVE